MLVLTELSRLRCQLMSPYARVHDPQQQETQQVVEADGPLRRTCGPQG